MTTIHCCQFLNDGCDLLLQGEVDVYKRGHDQMKLRLGRLEPKSFFGEYAVMSTSMDSDIRVGY